jgi:hypothetical protein
VDCHALRARNDEGRFRLALSEPLRARNDDDDSLIYIPDQAGSKAKLGQDVIFFEHE